MAFARSAEARLPSYLLPVRTHHRSVKTKQSVIGEQGFGYTQPMSLLQSDAGETIVAYCDGGSRGNPGPSGFGVYIQDAAGGVLAELSEFLGKRTNNFAEYSALLAALAFALKEGHPGLRVVSDSELMVKQIKGQYRVNSPELRPLYEEAKKRDRAVAAISH